MAGSIRYAIYEYLPDEDSDFSDEEKKAKEPVAKEPVAKELVAKETAVPPAPVAVATPPFKARLELVLESLGDDIMAVLL